MVINILIIVLIIPIIIKNLSYNEGYNQSLIDLKNELHTHELKLIKDCTVKDVIDQFLKEN
jgi:hypothetical protein